MRHDRAPETFLSVYPCLPAEASAQAGPSPVENLVAAPAALPPFVVIKQLVML